MQAEKLLHADIVIVLSYKEQLYIMLVTREQVDHTSAPADGSVSVINSSPYKRVDTVRPKHLICNPLLQIPCQIPKPILYDNPIKQKLSYPYNFSCFNYMHKGLQQTPYNSLKPLYSHGSSLLSFPSPPTPSVSRFTIEAWMSIHYTHAFVKYYINHGYIRLSNVLCVY